MEIQNEPVEDGHDDATQSEKVDGIVEQTQQDVGQGNVTDVADALRQRLDDAGIAVGEAEFAELLARVAG